MTTRHQYRDMVGSTGQLKVWCAGEDWRPVSTATVIGKKWYTMAPHRLLANGPSGSPR